MARRFETRIIPPQRTPPTERSEKFMGPKTLVKGTSFKNSSDPDVRYPDLSIIEVFRPQTKFARQVFVLTQFAYPSRFHVGS